MRIFLDTNLLLRLGDRGSPSHGEAVAAVDWLHAHGQECAIVPQVLYEYWVVATRPVNVNGLGMETGVVEQALEKWATLFKLLRDERGVFGYWRELVSAHEVKGKNAHDARLVAAMQRHRVTTLVLNPTHSVIVFGRLIGEHVAGRMSEFKGTS